MFEKSNERGRFSNKKRAYRKQMPLAVTLQLSPQPTRMWVVGLRVGNWGFMGIGLN